MTMTGNWSATGYHLTEYSFEEIKKICRMAGLSGIEGVPPLFLGRSVKELEQIGKEFRQSGLAIETCHLPFSDRDDIAAFYETERRSAVENMKASIERAVCLGARVVIQHPTTSHCGTRLEGFDRYLKQLMRSLEELIPLAEKSKVVIAIENMLPGGGEQFGSRPSHFERFIREISHPHLGFCLDTGHAFIAEGTDWIDKFCEAMGPYIAAFHLADNAGDRDSHLAPGHGRIQWAETFKRIAEMDFHRNICIETPPFDAGPNYTVDAWVKMIADINALLKSSVKIEPNEGND